MDKELEAKLRKRLEHNRQYIGTFQSPLKEFQHLIINILGDLRANHIANPQDNLITDDLSEALALYNATLGFAVRYDPKSNKFIQGDMRC